MKFAGQRPNCSALATASLPRALQASTASLSCFQGLSHPSVVVLILPPPSLSPFESTLHPSIFSPPVPCSSTLAAMVPIGGLRARVIGSSDGLIAVPHPSHCLAASVAGAVRSNVLASVFKPTEKHPLFTVGLCFVSCPTTSRCLYAVHSMPVLSQTSRSISSGTSGRNGLSLSNRSAVAIAGWLLSV
jgi:hypothetical protein